MKIKNKLIVGFIAVVAFSAAVISVPTIIYQIKTINKNIYSNADIQMRAACSDIYAFLEKPDYVISAVSSYLDSVVDIELNKLEDYLKNLTKD